MRRAVVGIGNRLRGDDAVGPIVTETIGTLEDAVIYDGGTAPENLLGPLMEMAPANILLVDACDFGAEPGGFRFFDCAAIKLLTARQISTHTLPLALLAELLAAAQCSVELLAVQPERLDFGAPLSPSVARALPAVAAAIRTWAAGG